jgi:arylsulfatase A-like enzyme
MPTFVEAGRAEYPTKFNRFDILPMQGNSLMNVIEGRGNSGQRVICWEHEGNRAVRKGRWKLVSEYPGQWRTFYPNQSGKWELYDISLDRGEMNNLAEKYPQIVASLSEIYQQWADRVGVVDWGKITSSKGLSAGSQ